MYTDVSEFNLKKEDLLRVVQSGKRRLQTGIIVDFLVKRLARKTKKVFSSEPVLIGERAMVLNRKSVDLDWTEGINFLQ